MSEIAEKLNHFPLLWIKKLTKKYPDAEIYLVGGAVRDFLLGRDTKDLDFVVRNVEATKLEQFLSQQGEVNFVGKSFGVYKFWPTTPPTPPDRGGRDVVPPLSGGVGGVVGDGEFDIALPRTEHSFNTGGYKDVNVISSKQLKIEQDLERRDFTINAIALKLTIVNNEFKTEIIDPTKGQLDIKSKIIRTVGDPEERFQEDATRMLRAVRFACQLDFKLGPEVIAAIKKKVNLIKQIAPERISDELSRIIKSTNAELGFRLMQKLGVLKILIPELDFCVGVDQSRSHVYPVFEHVVRSLGFAAKRNFTQTMRWAALFHDIGKPSTKAKRNGIYTFYNHEQAGARMARKILRRLRYSEKLIKDVAHLVLHHMFYYNIGEITDSAVRRFIRKAGAHNVDDLINLRIVDRLGMGRPKAKPFKLIELERRVEEVSLDPISVLMLKINGGDVMKALKLKAGTQIGWILKALLAEVLEDPKKNNRKYLLGRLKEIGGLSEDDLRKLAPDLDYYEEKRREKFIGRQLVFKGKKLDRRVRKVYRN